MKPASDHHSIVTVVVGTSILRELGHNFWPRTPIIGTLWNAHWIISRSGFGLETIRAFQVLLWMVLLLSTLIPGWVVNTTIILLEVGKLIKSFFEGTATAYFPDTTCDFPSHLWDHVIIINLTFCKCAFCSHSAHNWSVVVMNCRWWVGWPSVFTIWVPLYVYRWVFPYACPWYRGWPIDLIKTSWITIRRLSLTHILILLPCAFISKS